MWWPTWAALGTVTRPDLRRACPASGQAASEVQRLSGRSQSRATFTQVGVDKGSADPVHGNRLPIGESVLGDGCGRPAFRVVAEAIRARDRHSPHPWPGETPRLPKLDLHPERPALRVTLRAAIVCCNSAPDAEARLSAPRRTSSSTDGPQGSAGSQRCQSRGPTAVSAAAASNTISRITSTGNPVLPTSARPESGLSVVAVVAPTGAFGPVGPGGGDDAGGAAALVDDRLRVEVLGELEPLPVDVGVLVVVGVVFVLFELLLPPVVLFPVLLLEVSFVLDGFLLLLLLFGVEITGVGSGSGVVATGTGAGCTMAGLDDPPEGPARYCKVCEPK